MLSVLLSTKFCNYLLRWRYCRAPKKRSSDGSKCENIGTDVILAHKQLVVPKRNLYKKMTSHNEKKIKNKMTKDSSLFSCVFEDHCMNISFHNCVPKTSIFLTSFCDKEMASCSM